MHHRCEHVPRCLNLDLRSDIYIMTRHYTQHENPLLTSPDTVQPSQQRTLPSPHRRTHSPQAGDTRTPGPGRIAGFNVKSYKTLRAVSPRQHLSNAMKRVLVHGPDLYRFAKSEGTHVQTRPSEDPRTDYDGLKSS